MKMRLLVVPILFLLLMGMITVPQANASTLPSVHFDSSPITSWYNQTPYEYAASISAPYNWTLKTNASLHMSGGNTVNDTAAQTVFGILSTGSYWVNLSITYHNVTNVTTLLIYQNFTLTILNKPYIYSTPETFFYQDSTYNYTYEVNQGNITNYSSGLTLNRTAHTLSEYLSGTSYSFFLTVSDKNGSYTQDWGVSTNGISNYTFVADLNGTDVNVNSIFAQLGFSNTSIYMASSPVLTVAKTTYNYSFSIISTTEYSISTTSVNAPNVTLTFNLLVPGTYVVYMINKGLSSLVKTVSSSGSVSVIYSPSTMPLDPTFEVQPTTVGVSPIVPPIAPVIPRVLFGIPYLNVIVLFGGIALASEEFFRTQTKGKEKKYSYTGIFVGIMIAGIGLMSVL
jgi:hypothetical protein